MGVMSCSLKGTQVDQFDAICVDNGAIRLGEVVRTLWQHQCSCEVYITPFRSPLDWSGIKDSRRWLPTVCRVIPSIRQSSKSARTDANRPFHAVNLDEH